MVKDCYRLFGILFILTVGGCTHGLESRHEVDPIHITIDVNVKVERELEEFFGEVDTAEEELDIDKALDDFFGEINKEKSEIKKTGIDN